MKKNIRNQKGITLLIVVITIVILLILVGVTIDNIDIGSDIRNYNYMCADIELLKGKIQIYYNQYKSLPIIGEDIADKSDLNGQADIEDDEVYYQIDVSQISNVTLNYGRGSLENRDIYIVNKKTHNVYYLSGIIYEEEIRHTEY